MQIVYMPYMTMQEIEQFDFCNDKSLMNDDCDALGQVVKQNIALKMGAGTALGVQSQNKKSMANLDNMQDGDALQADNFGGDGDDAGGLLENLNFFD